MTLCFYKWWHSILHHNKIQLGFYFLLVFENRETCRDIILSLSGLEVSAMFLYMVSGCWI